MESDRDIRVEEDCREPGVKKQANKTSHRRAVGVWPGGGGPLRPVVTPGPASSLVSELASRAESCHISRSIMPNETFPIDLKALKPLKLDPKATSLTDEQKAALKFNIDLCRDAIVFFTAYA